jgi:hypothetical protein
VVTREVLVARGYAVYREEEDGPEPHPLSAAPGR